MNFEKELEATLSRLLKNTPAALAESVRYSLLAPGKRIRPRLVLATSRLLGLAPDKALPSAIALKWSIVLR